mgnify:CR=1 FL=1
MTIKDIARLSGVDMISRMPTEIMVGLSMGTTTMKKVRTGPQPSMAAASSISRKGMTFGNYPFWNSVKYSVVITILSTALILIGTSMAAWYIEVR